MARSACKHLVASKRHASSISVNRYCPLRCFLCKADPKWLVSMKEQTWQSIQAYFFLLDTSLSKTLSRASKPSCLRDRNSSTHGILLVLNISVKEAKCRVTASIGVFLRWKKMQSIFHHCRLGKGIIPLTCFASVPRNNKVDRA